MADYYTPFMLRTLNVLPGLTSPGSLDYFAREERLPSDPAEAERVYVSTLLPRKAALDLVYIEHRSWHYDLAAGAAHRRLDARRTDSLLAPVRVGASRGGRAHAEPLPTARCPRS